MSTGRRGERVLVTGASGFIGSHLAAHLAKRGDRVRCLVRRSSSLRYLRDLDAELAYGDLTGKDDLAPALDGVDVVYAVAGVTRPRRPADCQRGNRDATERLVHACLTAQQRGLCRLRRLVLVSSLAAAGPSPDGVPLTEDAPVRPISVYGRAKLQAEQIVWRAGPGLPATVVRPPIVYGPRDTDFYLIIQSARRGWLAQIGAPRGSCYSLIHVDDLVRVLVLVGDREEAAGQTYYLTGAPACSWGDLLELLSNLLGRRVRTLRLPSFVGWCAGAASELAAGLSRRTFILSRDKVREALQGRWVCDAAKAARELGYRAAIPLAEGLRDTIHWYRRQGWL
jgi:nucleoside-diphosphate-sugar epimerase